MKIKQIQVQLISIAKEAGYTPAEALYCAEVTLKVWRRTNRNTDRAYSVFVLDEGDSDTARERLKQVMRKNHEVMQLAAKRNDGGV